MARRFRGFWGIAAGFAVLSCALLIAGTDRGAAQSAQGSPQTGSAAAQGSGGNSSAASPPGEFSGGASDFLKVPLVNNVPGGATPETNIKSPVANDPAAAQRGMTYFISFNCVGCHAPNGGGGMGPSLSDRNFKYGSDPAQLFLVISHGAPLGMPSWGSVLPEQAIWDLVAYVESISQAPQPEWGQTVSPTAGRPEVEQVPAEFKQSPTPWQFTQRFGNGQAPPGSGSTSQGGPPPSSGSSGQ